MAAHDDDALIDARVLTEVDVSGLVARQYRLDMKSLRQYLAFL